MFSFLKGVRGHRRNQASRPTFRPRLEALEARRLMTVSNLGGPVIANVEIQPVYYGTQWTTPGTAAAGMVGPLNTFVGKVVQSSFMDMLTHAGYNVGRGSSDAALFTSGTVTSGPPATSITQTDLEATLFKDVVQGLLKPADANRLYLVFVQPGTTVTIPGRSGFAGFHDAFVGFNSAGTMAKIRYAFVLYPGPGTTVTTQDGIPLNPLDQLTTLASHEIAEAVTDPDVSLHEGPFVLNNPAWLDNSSALAKIGGGEVADLVNSYAPNQGYSIVYLNGFAVTRIADRNDQPMTPAGAQPFRPVNFTLDTTGTLSVSGTAVPTFAPVKAISDQSIDTNGFAVIDVLFANNQVYEYHDRLGSASKWVSVPAGASPVKQVVSGQGVSYVLYADGRVWEFNDSQRTFGSTYIVSGISQIDAGTDRYGVNMVDVLMGGWVFEESDSTKGHFIRTGALSVSAGQQGVSAILLPGGNFVSYDETTNSFPISWNGGLVTAVTAGTDQNGNALIVSRLGNGEVMAFDVNLFVSNGWGVLWNGGFQSITKAHAGVIDMMWSSATAYSLRLSSTQSGLGVAGGTWSLLGSGIQQAV